MGGDAREFRFRFHIIGRCSEHIRRHHFRSIANPLAVYKYIDQYGCKNRWQKLQHVRFCILCLRLLENFARFLMQHYRFQIDCFPREFRLK